MFIKIINMFIFFSIYKSFKVYGKYTCSLKVINMFVFFSIRKATEGEYIMEYTPWVLVREKKKIYIELVVIGESSLLFGSWLVRKLCLRLSVGAVGFPMQQDFKFRFKSFHTRRMMSPASKIGKAIL